MPIRRDRHRNLEGHAWSLSEEQIVRLHYPAGGADACVPLLPGRSRTAVVCRATKLRVRGDFQKRTDPSPVQIAVMSAAIRAANDERLLQSAGPVWQHAYPRPFRCRGRRAAEVT